MTADDLSRVLADIDSLLPPGAPSGDLISPDAMRWSPVDHDDHPEQSAPDPLRRYFHDRAVLDRLLDLYPNAHGWIAPGVGRIDLAAAGGDWAAEPVPPAGLGIQTLMRAAVAHESAAYRESLEQLGLTAQQTGTNLQHLRAHWDRNTQAQAVIEARRHRNTGPNNPRGADGRARRHQHPRKAAARNASPATQGNATPATRGWLDLIGEPEPWPATVIARRGDGSVVLGFDPAWQ